LFEWKLTALFRRPVDPEAEELPDYFEKVTRPMDLETVRNMLYDGKYLGVPSFMADLRLIWENTKAYHGVESVMGLISDEILQFLDKEKEKANLSSEQVWCRKLDVIQTKIEAHVQKKESFYSGQ
jgi:hypothetical protein